MTLLPEPREARIRGRVLVADATRAAHIESEARWSEIGHTDSTPFIARETWDTAAVGEALERLSHEVMAAFTALAHQVVVTVNAVDWDNLLIMVAAGTKNRRLRLERKKAKKRSARRAKAARINAQPSRGGKPAWK